MKNLTFFLSILSTCCNINANQTLKVPASVAKINKMIDTIPVLYTSVISEQIEATDTDSVVVIGKTAPRTTDGAPIFDNKVDSLEQLFGTWQLTEIFQSDPEKEDNPPKELRFSKEEAYLLISKDAIVQGFPHNPCNQINPIYRFGTTDIYVKYVKYTSMWKYSYKNNRKYLIHLNVERWTDQFGSTFEVIDKNEILYNRQLVYRRVKSRILKN
jgi:hypothetical protein